MRWRWPSCIGYRDIADDLEQRNKSGPGGILDSFATYALLALGEIGPVVFYLQEKQGASPYPSGPSLNSPEIDLSTCNISMLPQRGFPLFTTAVAECK